MKFSILIANYNNGKFFKDCYNSLILQTYHNWEAVILDDCSTDDSMEIIRNMIGNDRRFRLYANEKNYGVAVTKSKLIELADGDICGFVDPDDSISSTAVFSSIVVFTAYSDVVLAYSRFICCDENLTPINVAKLSKQVRNNDRYFFNYPLQVAHFATFRKDVYDQTLKIDTTLKVAVDQDLYLKLYEKGRFVFIDDANYYYRLHSGGISQNANKEKSRESFAKIIFNTMKRRNLKVINGKAVPNQYNSSNEIYDLLKYKNSILYRIKNKINLSVELFLEKLISS